MRSLLCIFRATVTIVFKQLLWGMLCFEMVVLYMFHATVVVACVYVLFVCRVLLSLMMMRLLYMLRTFIVVCSVVVVITIISIILIIIIVVVGVVLSSSFVCFRISSSKEVAPTCRAAAHERGFSSRVI